MATTTTTKELELTLTMHNSATPADIRERKITIKDPITTTAGLSAIKEFKNYLLSASTVEAEGILPNAFFQPTDFSGTGYFITDTISSVIIETTKTVTPVE